MSRKHQIKAQHSSSTLSSSFCHDCAHCFHYSCDHSCVRGVPDDGGLGRAGDDEDLGDELDDCDDDTRTTAIIIVVITIAITDLLVLVLLALVMAIVWSRVFS